MENVQVGESYAQQSASDVAVVGMELVQSSQAHEGDTSRASKRSIAWTELETFVLLEAWGERLLRSTRRSVQSAEWDEVSEKVSEVSRCTRNQTHCRNRLDTLKRLYKKEKARFAEIVDYTSDWVYFSKMDWIVSSSIDPTVGMVNNEVYPSDTDPSGEKRNELRGDADSASQSDSLQGLPPSKKRKYDNVEDTRPQKRRERKERGGRKPYKILAACLNKFFGIYERLEKSRIDHMFELEKMRMAFQKDLELERIKFLTTWQTEMAKIRRN